MKIYIASSKKNSAAVELLTAELVGSFGHEVSSFLSYQPTSAEQFGPDPFKAADGINPPIMSYSDGWLSREEAADRFKYDVNSALKSDLVIYIGPSGADSWAQVGAAYCFDCKIYGLWAKGEQVGLMRMMVGKWFDEVADLLEAVCKLAEKRRNNG